MRIRVSCVTVSDRAASGVRPDASGPALIEAIQSLGWIVANQGTLPDDQALISETLARWADAGSADVILTTGGTGFAPRDVTPEATLAVIEREAPGLTEAMRSASAKNSPHAMLSRARAGIRRRTVIVNLPGSPRAAVDNFRVVAPALEHAIELLQERPEAESGHAKGVV